MRHKRFTPPTNVRGRDKPIILIILTFIALTTAWNVLIPPYENLDEIEHAEVARHIAVTGRLPVHNEAEAQGYHVRQEASQPPLYHILAAGWTHLWQLPDTPHSPKAIPQQVVACGPTDTFYNKATWARNPYQDGPPWTGTLRTLHALRLFSTLLQVATVVGVWTLARRAFPPSVAYMATALVAFNPQFLLVASGVNNDNAVTPLATWGLVLAYDLWDRGPNLRRVLLFGALGGMAGVSKLSGIAVWGLGGLALLIRFMQHKMPFTHLVGWSILMTLLTVAIIAPWLLHNVQLYGDPTALAPMLEKVGRRDYSMDLNEIKLTLLSYWGQLPCTFYPRALYGPYWALMISGIVGLFLGWRHFNPRQKIMLAMAGIWFTVIVLAWLRWNRITPATGGRLLFPAIAALALILASGLAQLTHLGSNISRHQSNKLLIRFVAALLPLWALLILRAGPVMLFAPPTRIPVDTDLPNPSQIRFGDHLMLRGYEVHMQKSSSICKLGLTKACRPALDVTLYWQALHPLQNNYVMALQLVSPIPGETALRLNYNHWPGHGNLPTAAMPVNHILRDSYVLPLPQSDGPTQAWSLQIIFTDEEIGHLPVHVDGAPVGDTARLCTLRVPGAQPHPPATDTLTPPVTFGDNITLLAAKVESTDTIWHVELLWKSQSNPQKDYTVFVHAYDANGELLATGDAPPQYGHFPTSLWKTGDHILDPHHISLPADAQPASIAVGLYVPQSGERLPANVAGAGLANNAAVIWETQP